MKNRELIERLKQFPLDAEVVTNLESLEEYWWSGEPTIGEITQNSCGEIEIHID